MKVVDNISSTMMHTFDFVVGDKTECYGLDTVEHHRQLLAI